MIIPGAVRLQDPNEHYDSPNFVAKEDFCLGPVFQQFAFLPKPDISILEIIDLFYRSAQEKPGTDRA